MQTSVLEVTNRLKLAKSIADNLTSCDIGLHKSRNATQNQSF